MQDDHENGARKQLIFFAEKLKSSAAKNISTLQNFLIMSDVPMDPHAIRKIIQALVEAGRLVYGHELGDGMRNSIHLVPTGSSYEERLRNLFEILRRHLSLFPILSSLSSTYIYPHTVNRVTLSLYPNIKFGKLGCVICESEVTYRGPLMERTILIRGYIGYRCEDCHKADIRRCDICLYSDCKKERCMYHIIWVLRQKVMLKDLCRIIVQLLKTDAQTTCL